PLSMFTAIGVWPTPLRPGGEAYPTAMHLAAVVHATEERPDSHEKRVGRTLGALHLPALSVSSKARKTPGEAGLPGLIVPTTVQSFRSMQVIEAGWTATGAWTWGFDGVGSRLEVPQVPLTSVSTNSGHEYAGGFVVALPTATQFPALAHHTLASSASVNPTGRGSVSLDAAHAPDDSTTDKGRRRPYDEPGIKALPTARHE